jgi:hypothetical protein
MYSDAAIWVLPSPCLHMRPANLLWQGCCCACLAPLRSFQLCLQLDPLSWDGGVRFWEEGQLRDLCSMVGLQHFTRERRSRFIMFCATKPPVAMVGDDSGG